MNGDIGDSPGVRDAQRVGDLGVALDELRGFLSVEEGDALYRHGLQAAARGPLLEVGSYCGKSTVCLALAARDRDSLVFAVDHHAGSEEHQVGESHHDADLVDPRTGRFDSFPEFRATLRRFDVAGHVVPIVAPSVRAARFWGTPLGMVFIDGAHGLASVLADYRAWSGHLLPGGLLALHDVYPDPQDGGRAPYLVWQMALASGLYDELPLAGSLALLRRLGP